MADSPEARFSSHNATNGRRHLRRRGDDNAGPAHRGNPGSQVGSDGREDFGRAVAKPPRWLSSGRKKSSASGRRSTPTWPSRTLGSKDRCRTTSSTPE
jgi:hypothetical protein